VNHEVDVVKEEPSYCVQFVGGPKDGETLEVPKLKSCIEFVHAATRPDLRGKAPLAPVEMTPVFYSVAGRGDMLMRDDAPRVIYLARWAGTKNPR
jgi:hypothetical protein